MVDDSPFIARMNFPSSEVPFRAYLHQSGFESAYGRRISDVYDYLRATMGSLEAKGHLEGFEYLIPIVWGNDEDKFIDIFAYSDVTDNWPGNPDVSNLTVKGSLIMPRREELVTTTCGDGLILLGREEDYRRKTECLEYYLKEPPNDEDLGRVSPRRKMHM
ncbi:hypothetical protein CMI42_05905 [Candidatus Pacearchaeota archaeon]|nr:hypothetical protein [Candidatus Pacearchaeota archaeon]